MYKIKGYTDTVAEVAEESMQQAIESVKCTDDYATSGEVYEISVLQKLGLMHSFT